MTTTKTLLSFLIAFCIVLPAGAAQDPAQYRLKPETLRKLEAAHAETKQLAKKDGKGGKDDASDEQADDPEEEEEEEEEPARDAKGNAGKKDETPEGIARKIDADPKMKALLQKHGLSSMEYAMTVHAMLHAGMFLMFEQSMPKEKAKELFDGYTGAQRDNIELLRKSAIVRQ
jgi:ABC-type nitrate/sulfonate/bicarbonate transport system substrate-binding protein